MRKTNRVCTSLAFALIITTSISTTLSVAELSTEALGSGLGRFNSIKVFHLDGDGSKEIIFGNYEGFVHILEYKNNEWTLKRKSDDLGDRLWGLAVGDVDSDGDIEIVVGNGDGYVYVLDAVTLSIKWKSEDLGSDAHGIAIADVDYDGVTDIIVGTGFRTDNGYLYVFNGKNYTLKWKSGPWESKLRGIAVGDVDSDGVTEIVVGSGIGVGEGAGEGYIRIFNGQNSTLEWKSDNLGGDVEAIEISDVDS
ncbi:MAG: FG-GAP-like repeat-containing protein, partial [Candidatus Thermoplasmatota archaeon]|nr:FG-GAP-like repeat-containing protein [Candidatus Thermoplasmatota archaeon]